MVISAAGAWASTTNGASEPTKVEFTNNKVNKYFIEFDDTSVEYIEATAVLPENYDGGTIRAKFYWTYPSGAGATGQTVVWGIQARATRDGEVIDSAFGTTQTVTDTAILDNNTHISGWTSAITIGNNPQAGDIVQFRIYRNATSDNLSGKARFESAVIEYSIDNLSE